MTVTHQAELSSSRTELETESERIGSRLRYVREEIATVSHLTFAKLLGVARSTVIRYETGERTPDANLLFRLHQKYRVSPLWLLAGKGPVLDDTAFTSQERASHDVTEEGEFSLVPFYDVAASAGYGAVIENEQQVSRLAFRRDWLRQIGLNINKLASIRVTGDSMSPTLIDGDTVLIDTSVKTVGSDSIYCLRMDGHLYIKRVQRLSDGSLRISSDNKAAYADEVTDGKSLDVVGLVVWTGRTLIGSRRLAPLKAEFPGESKYAW